MLAIRSNAAYLIPFQQVVCDFGSVVAWGLIDDGEMRNKRNQEISWSSDGLNAWPRFHQRPRILSGKLMSAGKK